jgi:hypothetical protein
MVKIDKELGFVLVSDIFLGYVENKLSYILYFGEPFDNKKINIYLYSLMEKNSTRIAVCNYSELNKLLPTKKLYAILNSIEDETGIDFYLFEKSKYNNAQISNYIEYYIKTGDISENITDEDIKRAI